MNRDEIQEILLSLLQGAMGRSGGAAGNHGEDAGEAGETAARAANPLWASAMVAGANSLQRLLDASQAQTEKLGENTKALTETAAGRAAGIATAVKGGMGGGLPGMGLFASPLFSLASGLARLFGGGEVSEPAAPVRHRRPPELSIEAGFVSPQGMASAVDHDLEGRPRPIPATSAPQVTVNVQAMDSRSFLDHSDEIARAVREAILNSHSLNELLSDL